MRSHPIAKQLSSQKWCGVDQSDLYRTDVVRRLIASLNASKEEE
jgi:hypothetical protein